LIRAIALPSRQRTGIGGFNRRMEKNTRAKRGTPPNGE